LGKVRHGLLAGHLLNVSSTLSTGRPRGIWSAASMIAMSPTPWVRRPRCKDGNRCTAALAGASATGSSGSASDSQTRELTARVLTAKPGGWTAAAHGCRNPSTSWRIWKAALAASAPADGSPQLTSSGTPS